MKNLLIYLKNDEIVSKYKTFLTKGYKETDTYSHEVREMINEFINNNWNVFLSSIENFDENKNEYIRIYDIKNNEDISLTIDEVNEKVNAMIIRVIGSIEGNFNNIKNHLSYLEKNYHGLVINDPKAMIKGMTKHYLKEIEELKEISLIPTEIYDNKIKLSELNKKYKNKKEYLIKPVSGELSNSLMNLNDVTEEILRYKENKVLGWVIQPIMKEIWNGEYQMVFLGKELIYSQKKEYENNNELIPNQKKRTLIKYNPTEAEITIGKKLIDYFSKKYNLKIHICRIDFMKDKNDKPILLEFEMVNPGFFIGYMKENDKDIKNITKSIRKYCEINTK